MSKMCVLNYTLCFIGNACLYYKMSISISNTIYNHYTVSNDDTNLKIFSLTTK